LERAPEALPCLGLHRRLEDLPEDEPAKILHTFDARLAAAAKALHQQGLWEGLMAAGGSSLRPQQQQQQQQLQQQQQAVPSTTGRDADSNGSLASAGHAHPGGTAALVANSRSHNDSLLQNGRLEESGRIEGQRGPGAADSGGCIDGGDVALGQQLVDFWLNLCLCHMLIVEQGGEEEDEEDDSVSRRSRKADGSSGKGSRKDKDPSAGTPNGKQHAPVFQVCLAAPQCLCIEHFPCPKAGSAAGHRCPALLNPGNADCVPLCYHGILALFIRRPALEQC
jgi:hypothetical protein